MPSLIMNGVFHFHDNEHNIFLDNKLFTLSWSYLSSQWWSRPQRWRRLTTTGRCSSFRFAFFTVMTPAKTFFSITIVKINMIYHHNGDHDHKDDADWQLAAAAAAATEMGVGRETFVPAIKLLTWTWSSHHLWSVAGWLRLENVGKIQAQFLKLNWALISLMLLINKGSSKSGERIRSVKMMLVSRIQREWIQTLIRNFVIFLVDCQRHKPPTCSTFERSILISGPIGHNLDREG